MRILFIFSFLFFASISWAQIDITNLGWSMESRWVDSVYNSLNEEQRIGQLFMVRAHSNKGPEHEAAVRAMVEKNAIGGVLFFQGTPRKQAELTNLYQSKSQVPLLVGIDGEWGLGMRLDKTISYPRQLMLGAMSDNRPIYEMGKQVAEQCKRLGIHVNLAPVVDVNNNPDNPVINDRSFGEDRYNVTAKSYMYIRGMQDHGIMACAKHFPGHGDTDVDSHLDLPIIRHNKNRLDSIELFPFRILGQYGLQSMMIAHLNIPALDSTKNSPSTLSRKIITDLLRDELGFKGLVFTDAMDMKGVTKYFPQGEANVAALKAGNDVLLLPGDVGASVKAIQVAIEKGELNPLEVEGHIKKILRAKYRLGLHNYKPIVLTNLERDLNKDEYKVMIRKLVRNSLTLVRNQNDLIPFQKLDTLSIASVAIGRNRQTDFQKSLNNFSPMKMHHTGTEISAATSASLIKQLKNKDVVVVSVHNMSKYSSKEFGIKESVRKFIEALSKETKVVLTLFGSPYALKYFDAQEHILVAYNDSEDSQDLAAQSLFGVFGLNGKLPVSASPKSKFGNGVPTNSLQRMGYGMPAEVGLNPLVLNNIDTIVADAISTKATPGCQVLVAKNGKIVFNRAYGYHTYAKKRKNKSTDLYDLASITKIAASTVSIMKLQEEGKIDVNNPLSSYLPILKNSNKENIRIKDMMVHRAALTDWIPFYEQTLNKYKKPSTKYYSTKKSAIYNVQVSDKLYMKQEFVDEMWKQIVDSEIRPNNNYKYSDLGFIMFARTIQEITLKPIDQYAHETFYGPLGLKTMGYKPLEKHSKSNITPSESDTYFRHNVVKGHVHDMAAAMLGGVSGHAGLFSDANDLAILMQMLLNGGYYGGVQYLSPETINQFTSRCPDCSRRGLGFDMYQTDASLTQNFSDKASLKTFGHLGFTGTCVWADPEHDLIYIFLSNRTYPSMKNFKLAKEDYRPRIQTVIYEAMGL